MDDVVQSLKKVGFKGDLDSAPATLEAFSHDASMFELRPELVVAPKDTKDLERLVSTVANLKKKHPKLSLTARSAGTDMSGAAINDSIIIDFRKYFTAIKAVDSHKAHVEPGVLYRDFEAETFKHQALMPSYPASRDLASVGGMVNNNSGGEKSLEFGKTQDFVTELEFVFADGVARTVKPLNKSELAKKMKQKDFEGTVYRELYELIESNYEVIKNAKPKVSKNSTGYNLWDVWDRETGVFDLTQLIVGAQGTLGFVSDIHFDLVRHRPHSGLLILFMRDINALGETVNKVLESKPASFECFDDNTLFFIMKYMIYFAKTLGIWGLVKLAFSLIPEGLQLLRGVPKMVLMVEFNGETEAEVRRKVHELHRTLGKQRARYEINGFEEDPTEGKSEKFWIMRRQAFNLLRHTVRDKHTAPFIDDLVVNPPYLPDFLPKIRAIIKKYKLLATVQGHIGDGNFHIIPLMKLEDKKERAKLLPAMKEVNRLVLKYRGSLSGEHNDGLVRGPWLEEMYGSEVLNLFKQAKHIMDPDNICNPHKKSDANWEYSFSHIRDHF